MLKKIYAPQKIFCTYHRLETVYFGRNFLLSNPDIYYDPLYYTGVALAYHANRHPLSKRLGHVTEGLEIA